MPSWRARIVECLAVPMMHFHNFHVNVAISLNYIPQIPLIGSVIGVQLTTSKGRHLESIAKAGSIYGRHFYASNSIFIPHGVEKLSSHVKRQVGISKFEKATRRSVEMKSLQFQRKRKEFGVSCDEKHSSINSSKSVWRSA